MSARAALVYCALALLLFALLAYSAVSTQSATVDEPEHVCTAYLALRDGDFRAEPDHPPLWKYFAALPLLAGKPIDLHTDSPAFHDIPFNVQSVIPWSVATLYHTPANDADRILRSARVMMLLCGIALGGLTAFFANRLAGPRGACVAATLFCLDPNFLAHAPLVKNDVPLALAVTALAYFLYLACQRLTPGRLVAICLCCAACVTTKLTGLLAGPIVILTLAARAILPARWPSSLFPSPSRGQRFATVAGVALACAVFTYVSVWAVYRFRFNPSSDSSVHYNTAQFLNMAAGTDLGPAAAPAERAAWRAPVSIRLAMAALDRRLLPEPFLEGLIYARSVAARPGFVLDTVYTGGRWYYFPLAFAVKTPLATLVVLLVSIPFWAGRLRSVPPGALPFLATVVVFVAVSVPSGMNIGLRHLFPIVPVLYVAAAWVVARQYAARPRWVRPALLVVPLLLAAETFTAYPHFIPFFNVAAGGARGGLHLLSDSNLDWGQDLPLLAEWQRAHPGRTLHLAYYGFADPAVYGIRYVNAPRGYPFGPDPEPVLPTSGVLAVSATTLQGVYDPRRDRPTYAPFLHRVPTELLGGSIYLFDLGGD